MATAMGGGPYRWESLNTSVLFARGCRRLLLPLLLLFLVTWSPTSRPTPASWLCPITPTEYRTDRGTESLETPLPKDSFLPAFELAQASLIPVSFSFFVSTTSRNPSLPQGGPRLSQRAKKKRTRPSLFVLLCPLRIQSTLFARL